MFKDVFCCNLDENKIEFCKLLKKANDLVLIKNDTEETIRLIIDYKGVTFAHNFNAKGLIKYSHIRHVVYIERNIIKKLIKPKTEFYFNVHKDAKRNQYHEKNNLHSDAVYLVIGEYEMLLDVQTCEDNSARMINNG